jgi:ankyrin repeat protein
MDLSKISTKSLVYILENMDSIFLLFLHRISNNVNILKELEKREEFIKYILKSRTLRQILKNCFIDYLDGIIWKFFYKKHLSKFYLQNEQKIHAKKKFKISFYEEKQIASEHFSQNEKIIFMNLINFMRKGDENENIIDVNKKNVEGKTLLMIAVEENDMEIVKKLLENDAIPNIQIIKNKNKIITPLSIAICEKNCEMVDILLNYGADPKIRDIYNRGIIFKAAKRNFAYAIDKFMEKGCNITDDFEEYKMGDTLLMYAVMYGSRDFVKKLLDIGCDPIKKNNFGTSALMISVYSQFGNVEIFNDLFCAEQNILKDPKITANDGLRAISIYGKPLSDSQKKIQKICLENGGNELLLRKTTMNYSI